MNTRKAQAGFTGAEIVLVIALGSFLLLHPIIKADREQKATIAEQAEQIEQLKQEQSDD